MEDDDANLSMAVDATAFATAKKNNELSKKVR